MPAVAPVLADRLALIIEALCHAVARRAGLGGLAGPLVILIWLRLRRLKTRFTRLATRPATHGPARSRSASTPPSRPPAPHHTPRNFAWLLRLVPETAPIAAQLRHLLADPEMAALLTKAPGLGRALRPLSRMLGIRPAQTPSLPPPRRAISSRPASPRVPPPIPPPSLALPLGLSPAPA